MYQVGQRMQVKLNTPPPGLKTCMGGCIGEVNFVSLNDVTLTFNILSLPSEVIHGLMYIDKIVPTDAREVDLYFLEDSLEFYV